MATATRKSAARPRRSRDLDGSLAVPEKPEPVLNPEGIAVRAKTHGFYGATRRFPGDEFFLDHHSHLSDWMEKIGPGKSTLTAPAKDAKPAAGKKKSDVLGD